MIPLLCCVLAALCAVPATAMAQAAVTASGWVSDEWTTDDGLPQNAIQEIIQDRSGYLWLATPGGVSRFDGVTFTNLSSGTRNGLLSDRVLYVAEANDGHIWLGTENGLSRFDGMQFRTWTPADGLPGAAITALARHPAAGVVFGTRTGGFGVVEDTVVRVLAPPGGLLEEPVSRIVVDAIGDVWVWARSGVWLADLTARSFTLKLSPRRAKETAPMAAALGGGIWAATDSGVVHVTRNSVADYPIRHLLGDPQTMCRRGPSCGPWVDLVDITTIAPYDEQSLVLGTRMGEVWMFRPDSLNTPHAVERIATLERGATNAIIVDREKNLWIGTALAGLIRLRPSLLQVYTTADGLANDVLAAVFTDAQGRVWVGGNCGGLSIREDDTFRVVRASDGLRNECVWSFAQDTAGAVWVGTYGGGIGRWINGFTGWYTMREGLPSDAVLALARDADGTLWVGTDGGLAAWNGRSFRSVPLAIPGFTPDVRTILPARDGSLWLGTTRGLAHRSPAGTRLYTRADGLPNDFVRAIHEDQDGTIWGGTYGGGMFRLRRGRISSVGVADGLYDNFISSIVDDGRGSFWMSTNRGIVRVSRSSLEEHADGRRPRIQSVAYGRNDGMLSSETNGGFQPAVTRTEDGRLWYPTMYGLAVIDPEQALRNPVPPGVVIEQVTVNGSEVPANADIQAGPGTADVVISYSGVSFTAPDAVTFRYRLDGWDEDWVEAGARRFASYSRLPAGRYRFLVTAANRDGVWSAPTSLDVAVRPQPWQTWWFRTLAALVLLAAVAAAFQARIRMLRRSAAIEAQNTSRRQVTAILESITDAFVALDTEWQFTYVNHTAEQLLHESRGDLVGRNFWDVFPEAFGAETEANLRAVMTERKPLVFDAPQRTAYGQWLGIHAYPAQDGISIYISDITARRNAEEALRKQSLRDDLTGVFNRRGFLLHAEHQSLVAHRSQRPFDIVFIDMDGMKHINDTLGHVTGDAALRDTAALLQKTFRETDVIARLGGDEFAILVADSGEAEIALVLSRLRRALDAFNADAHQPFQLSLSTGVSRYDPSSPTPVEALLEQADRRMYEAKRAKGTGR